MSRVTDYFSNRPAILSDEQTISDLIGIGMRLSFDGKTASLFDGWGTREGGGVDVTVAQRMIPRLKRCGRDGGASFYCHVQ